MPSPKLMTVWWKVVRVTVVVTQCFDVGNILICRVFTTREDNFQYPLLQKFQRFWSSHSQPGMSEWAGVLEVWIWTYYIAETNTLDWSENAPKYAFRDPKKLFPPDFTPHGQGDTPPHTPLPLYSRRLWRLYSCAFDARLGPLQTQIRDPALPRRYWDLDLPTL